MLYFCREPGTCQGICHKHPVKGNITWAFQAHLAKLGLATKTKTPGGAAQRRRPLHLQQRPHRGPKRSHQRGGSRGKNGHTPQQCREAEWKVIVTAQAARFDRVLTRAKSGSEWGVQRKMATCAENMGCTKPCTNWPQICGNIPQIC